VKIVFLIVALFVSKTTCAQQDEAAQVARFKSESVLCAAFYARTAMTSEDSQPAIRERPKFLRRSILIATL
jgi:hypothetical protein